MSGDAVSKYFTSVVKIENCNCKFMLLTAFPLLKRNDSKTTHFAKI